MNSTKQALWLACIVIVLACSGWYFSNGQSIGTLDKATLSTTVDAEVTQVSVKQFNTEGRLVNHLVSPLMRHIPKNDTHLFTDPLIIVAQNNQPAWTIQAQKAKATQGGKRIDFRNQVVIHQKGDAKTQESTLKTEQVTYFPQEKKATTEALITFEQPSNFIQSTGMQAFLDEKRIVLLHGAKGRYDNSSG